MRRLIPLLLVKNVFHGKTLSDHSLYSIFSKLIISYPSHYPSHQTYFTSSTLNKAKGGEKKAKNVIQFKPKSKQTVVELWKGVTPLDIADVTQRDIDDVFEAISYLETYELYQEVDSEITDFATITAIAKRLGFRVQLVKPPGSVAEEKKNKDVTKRPPPHPEDLVKRPPVVAIMGHVDHGKTTLLDSLRHSSIVSKEFGGITQHIGAFTVDLPGGRITFLDTPGHAAFKTMRARGARVTDFVILVVAADDGIMEQTIESIRYAREANVPIIVAVNKIDKANHDVKRVMQDLLGCGIQVEELGGEVQAIPISALKKINLDHLTDAILIQAEVMGVAGDPKGMVEGVVLEASLDTSKGKVSTALIQRGTLKKGSVIVAGTSWAKVRNLYDENGNVLKVATPGTPVQVVGWKSFPPTGEIILEVESERRAREVIRYRESVKMEEKMIADQEIIQKKADAHTEKYREERMARLSRGRYRKERNYFREKEFTLDSTPYVAFVLKGFIYTFNVSVPSEIKKMADEKGIKIKSFNVIYHLIADMKIEINSKLPLVEEEEFIGEATVLQEFVIKDGKKKLPVAGCRCIKGMLKKSALYKVTRNDQTLYSGPISSLKHEKTPVESIKKDTECGLMVEDPEVSFLPGDVITCFSLRTVAQVTDWNPGF
ncbi:translation initiation factor IF-2, mitochondrial isoform X2 [Parasteatoda tepidariorum]|uniref:translation initiation factor IF-2, mitochondrial isoform X2 n=1 Tax=Parasteatoda tepidariorum TaxID=114398 RepID=UPI0039BC7D25